ncbi:hypothetical protein P152DRAFT_296903 [Eremomyces bilateralis CBS 781.70]|uniref:F-box domain-containing protein n=1 Tax=Eremomyces bilateralis CBS 781.70 TaxID=1392243 RepID=A0A6G1G734_9PEZI|nr:uncharacterized protein P152DRAFT_296903 [Eremomyces bilateralis CBS 781.70]KAF1813887.1 hypothetical protein P152DRAFT_296903 [Eremomyces bilateralis CBS 781.70]
MTMGNTESNETPEAPETPLLLQLPVELVMMIVENLKLHDHLFLSQTCWDLRALLTSSCTTGVASLCRSGREREAFVTGLIG